MASSLQAAAMVMGGIPSTNAEEVLEEYARAGIRAFLLPGSLLAEPERLASLAALARRLVFEAAGSAAGRAFGGAAEGEALVALGGKSEARAVSPVSLDLPSPLCLAAGGERRAARLAGLFMGRAASSCGVDLVFAPRLDLATDPKAPGGILDLFGEYPQVVADFGAAFMRGMRRGGVAPCALAFPGCGSLSQDGRRGPPVLPFTADRIEGAELLPFARLVRGGLPAMLAARVYVPAFEPGRIPAARSALVIEGRLRSALGFHGLVIGDALDEDPEGPGRAAVLGALAGCDLTIALGKGAALEAARALAAAAEDGELPAPRLALASRRVRALLTGLKPVPRRERSLPLHASPLAAAFSLRAAERGATVLRAAMQPVGSRASRGLAAVVFVPPEMQARPEALSSCLDALRGQLPEGSRLYSLPVDPIEGDALKVLDEIVRGAQGRAQDLDALVLSCDAHAKPAQESFIHVLEESLGAVSLIALRDPYDAAFFPRSGMLGAVYGYSSASFRAAARLAMGLLRERGRCPVNVLGLEV